MKNIYITLFLGLLLVGSSCSKTELSTTQEDIIYVRSAGADIPAYVFGNGASKTFVVMIHGGPGGDGLEYRAGLSIKLLEEDYAFVYWDQRGQGMTHGAYSLDNLTVNTMADDLYALVKTLRAKYGEDISVFLMGHSWGGTLGTAYMVRENYQNAIEGWIEVDGAHDIPMLNKEGIQMFLTIGNDQVNKYAEAKDLWQEILDFADSVDTSNISTDESQKINDYGFKAEGYIQEITQDTSNTYLNSFTWFTNPSNILINKSNNNNTAQQLMNEVESMSLTNQLHKITAPTLLLWGKYDFVVSPALAYSAYSLINSPDKELVIFDHSGHSPMDNEPLLFVQVVQDFIEKHKK
ncbi:MAG: alpha/beta hydrolase [Aureispira sp.]|nr:alpha/beta hydrolase [Aureispira sp.]